MDLPPCSVAVDLVVLTIREDELHVLLVQRGVEPFLGAWALPGGFVLPDEGLASAAERELREETRIAGIGGHIEQLGSYGDPGRDPRGRVVAVAYLALVPDPGEADGGSDAAAARWTPVPEATGLAFDHDTILADGLDRARAKLEYTPLAMSFVPHPFTINELRGVYEVIWDTTLDPRNFHRKLTGAAGLLIRTGETTTRAGGRPAQLYRPGPATALHPPMVREAG